LLTSSKRSKEFENTKDTQISGTSSPRGQEGRRGTHTETFNEGACRGGSDRIQTQVCGEGGSGKKQGEKKWWEGDTISSSFSSLRAVPSEIY